MKIAIACNALGNTGGMERYTLSLLSGFRKLGLPQPIVFTKKITFLPSEIERDKVCVVSCRFLPSRLRDLYFSYQVGYLRKKYGIDLLIACSRINNADITCCGGTHRGFVTSKDKVSIYDHFIQEWETQIFRKTSVIVAHSELIEEDLLKLYHLKKEKIVLLYPPVSETVFPKLASQAIKQVKTEDKGVANLLWVSTSHKRKGLDLLVNAVENTDLPVTVSAVGRPLPSVYKKIHYQGFAENMAERYALADITVVPSIFEPFGLVAIESVLSGVPVVISNLCGCVGCLPPEVKEEFNPKEDGALYKAIQRALIRKNRGELLVTERDREILLERLDEQRHVRKILEFATENLSTNE